MTTPSAPSSAPRLLPTLLLGLGVAALALTTGYLAFPLSPGEALFADLPSPHGYHFGMSYTHAFSQYVAGSYAGLRLLTAAASLVALGLGMLSLPTRRYGRVVGGWLLALSMSLSVTIALACALFSYPSSPAPGTRTLLIGLPDHVWNHRALAVLVLLGVQVAAAALVRRRPRQPLTAPSPA